MTDFNLGFSIQSFSELKDNWDIIIIGGGPAGLSAALYAARGKKQTLVLERNSAPGGQIATTGIVEDYPGIEHISGPELSQAWAKHAQKFGAHIVYGVNVEEINFEQKYVKTSGIMRRTFYYKKLIITTGAIWNELGIKGEKEFRGRGVSYCAVCDAPFFKNTNVIVVGGGNSALDEALFIADNFANSVTIVHRRDKFKADKILQDRAMAHKKIKIMFNTELREIKGNETVKSVLLYNNKENKTFEIPIDAVFIFIGMIPNTEKFNLKKDEQGYIITDEKMKTSVKDVFAAGDCRRSALKQAINAASDGAIAAYFATREIDEEKS
ncbi:MAG: thioredoxin-disulfide reductase [Candidatus Anstonellales archaeon]